MKPPIRLFITRDDDVFTSAAARAHTVDCFTVPQADCRGVWGGAAALDACAVCQVRRGAAGSDACLDCAGVKYGPNARDGCGKPLPG